MLDDFRTCQFCSCVTNARQRRCCDEGQAEDRMVKDVLADLDKAATSNVVDGKPWSEFTPSERQRWAYEKIANMTPEVKAKGEDLVKLGFVQMSRKYRHVARSPSAPTVFTILQNVAPNEYKRIMERAESSAMDYYRTHIAAEGVDKLTLTIEEFAAFRKAGGQT